MSRRITPEINLNGESITKSLLPYLKSVSYTDNMSGAADDLQLSIEDKDGLMIDALPQQGDSLDVTVVATDWANMAPSLRLGKFEIDEIMYSGCPTVMQLKAVSIPYANTLRGEEHTRSWEKAELKTIANDIATGAEHELLYDSEENPTLDRVEQSEESNLSFLMRLCKDHGLALKVTDTQIVIFDEEIYEKAEPTVVIIKPGTIYTGSLTVVNEIKNYSMTVKTRDIYSACHVKYQESKDKATIEATYTVPGKKGKTLQVKEQVKSVAEAERLAKKKLREANKDEYTGNFSMLGNFALVAGITVEIVGFGAFDGKYIVTKADHSFSGGYTTKIDVRRCLDGY